MTQREMAETFSELVLTAERILMANGFQIVTDNDLFFPSIRPPLAAFKNGRLLVCVAKIYTVTDQFLNPDEMNRIRDELDNLAIANMPERDTRVRSVEKVAFVLVPGDITIASSAGDIKWVVVEEVDELPEEMDKVLGRA